ncbi:hypothetical protein QJS04_geneDACA024347 [Acorus gramineus]|uniref:Uncharacterized protein n=1 Tax=Acorus gramineus TaxID=55184 RepID=A0AAV8ZZ94_ACOGR|nr:hypothetical protein QJS04_geneDACA024347 [Acorus gramineus]
MVADSKGRWPVCAQAVGAHKSSQDPHHFNHQTLLRSKKIPTLSADLLKRHIGGDKFSHYPLAHEEELDILFGCSVAIGDGNKIPSGAKCVWRKEKSVTPTEESAARSQVKGSEPETAPSETPLTQPPSTICVRTEFGCSRSAFERHSIPREIAIGYVTIGMKNVKDLEGWMA